DARSFRPGPLQTTTVELGAGGTPLDVTSAKRRAFRSGIWTRILSLRLSAELPFCEVQGRGRPIPRPCRDIRRGPCMSRTAREARSARKNRDRGGTATGRKLGSRPGDVGLGDLFSSFERSGSMAERKARVGVGLVGLGFMGLTHLR